MFAIGYGIPPSGPLRAIRLAATPLAHEIAAYLATASVTTASPLTITADAQLAKSPRYK
jgi:hypothetical protein